MAKKNFGDPIDKMTAYCTYCPKMCRFSCPAAQAEDRETVTPWGMMRLFELVKDNAVAPSEEVAEIFYHCMGCRRCQTWCRHENDVPMAMWEARQWMAELGHVPAALQGFAEQFIEEKSPFQDTPALPEADGLSIEEVFDPHSSIVYMPDCETRQHYPDLVLRAGKLLEIFNGEKVRLHTKGHSTEHACCGFPLLSAGQKQVYVEHREALEQELSGADFVIAECAAMAALHRDGTSWGWQSDLKVVHLMEFLAERIEHVEPIQKMDLPGLMIHDSCVSGRQLHLYEPMRHIIRAICDEEPLEFQFNREEASCCGGPAHYHLVEPEASERCATDIIDQMKLEGGQQLLTGSATCKKAFRRVNDQEIALDMLEFTCRAFGV